MEKPDKNIVLAQSASALGAALLGFGIGAKWGMVINSTILIMVIVLGGMIHVGGMYVMQMKETERRDPLAKLLWITAWICLLFVFALFLYLFLAKK